MDLSAALSYRKLHSFSFELMGPSCLEIGARRRFISIISRGGGEQRESEVHTFVLCFSC